MRKTPDDRFKESRTTLSGTKVQILKALLRDLLYGYNSTNADANSRAQLSQSASCVAALLQLCCSLRSRAVGVSGELEASCCSSVAALLQLCCSPTAQILMQTAAAVLLLYYCCVTTDAAQISQSASCGITGTCQSSTRSYAHLLTTFSARRYSIFF